jgi:hypothetical protein
MNPSLLTVPANISLQKLVDDYFLPRGLRSAMVTQTAGYGNCKRCSFTGHRDIVGNVNMHSLAYSERVTFPLY